MAESIYNVFIFFENDLCSTVGYTSHENSGNDAQGSEYLRARLAEDFSTAKKLKLTNHFTRSEYNARCRVGEGHHLYDELFAMLNAGPAPLCVATPVKNGEVFFNYSSEQGDLDMNDISAKLGAKGVMVDWLARYSSERGIDSSQLIHDDYFLAIKLTFNARLYVSAMKLLVSCIDSLAYIEYGNERNSVPFTKWLDAYAELAPLGITAVELWELRNGILHMTTINSAKVRANKVRRISFRVGGSPDYPRHEDDVYYFDFYGLIQVVAAAQGRWIESYNKDRDKFAKFIERYDETISDSRLAFTHLGGAGYSPST
jgi:hypothetical protein